MHDPEKSESGIVAAKPSNKARRPVTELAEPRPRGTRAGKARTGHSTRLALTATEIAVLDCLVNDKPKARQKALSHYLINIARLGGYLARASDPPPGNTVMWRGLSRPPTSRWTSRAGENLWLVESRSRPPCRMRRVVENCRYG
ncbi:hypothetical protein [Bradyrhizobium sp. 197]|uniref:hypothetical protein n=1 Tax=Bradyrhizobium sp. 197 TaxID=2782663 RepID=UPI0023DF7F85|nr:hypothetical protein [Bradyrhizobium sp. 197]